MNNQYTIQHILLTAVLALLFFGGTFLHANAQYDIEQIFSEENVGISSISISEDKASILVTAFSTGGQLQLMGLNEHSNFPVYFSSNSGSSWQGIDINEGQLFGASAIVDDVLHVYGVPQNSLGFASLYVSSDDGQSWNLVESNDFDFTWLDATFFPSPLAISFVSAQGSSGIIKTQDGSPFTNIAPTVMGDLGEMTPDWNIAKATQTGDIIFANYTDRAGGSLYKFDQSWEFVNLPLPPIPQSNLWSSADISDNGEIFAMISRTRGDLSINGNNKFESGSLAITRDTGNSWEYLYPQGVGNISAWTDIAVSADGQVMIVAAQDLIIGSLGGPDETIAEGGLYISRDAGETWVQILDDHENQTWRSVALSQDGVVALVGNEEGEIYRISLMEDEEESPAQTTSRRRSSGGRASAAYLARAGITLDGDNRQADTTVDSDKTDRNTRIMELLTTLEKDGNGNITRAGFIQFIMGLIEILK